MPNPTVPAAAPGLPTETHAALISIMDGILCACDMLRCLTMAARDIGPDIKRNALNTVLNCATTRLMGVVNEVEDVRNGRRIETTEAAHV